MENGWMVVYCVNTIESTELLPMDIAVCSYYSN